MHDLDPVELSRQLKKPTGKLGKHGGGSYRYLPDGRASVMRI